jgi:hypothetical protein
MKKYIVRTGDIYAKVKATTHKKAVMKAIEKSKKKGLGVLTGCLEEGDYLDNEIYFKTENVLKDMGYELK